MSSYRIHAGQGKSGNLRLSQGEKLVCKKSGNLVVTNVILYFVLYFILRGAL